MKRSLAINLAVGTVLGIVLAGLSVYIVLSSVSSAGYLQEAVQMGYTPDEATARLVGLVAAACLIAFVYGLFLPLGRAAIVHARDTLLEGWLVGCLPWLIIQCFCLFAVLLVGSAVGVLYLACGLVRLKLVKRSIATEE